MHNYTKSILLASSSMLLLVGCSGTTTQAEVPNKVQRSQELVVSTNVKTTQAQKGSTTHYSLLLNNTTNSKADLVLENKGEKPLSISNIKLLDDTRLFKLESKCPSVIEGRQSCNLNVEFLGNNEGRFNAKIEITSDDIRRKVTNIAISAVSANKYSGILTKIDSATTKIERTVTLNFNSANKTQYVQVENNGKATLTLGQPSIQGADKSSFSIEKNSCGKTLEIGSTCEITVNYDAKKDGISDAKLDIPSNGDITPSRYVRLEGFSKPFNVKLEKFIVSKNVQDFMNDYFASNKKYFFRTIFQQETERAFEDAVDTEIQKYFKENGYKLADDSSDAESIVTLYPSVEITRNKAENNLVYNIVVNGQVTSKSTYDKNIKTMQDGNITSDHNTKNTQFSSITLNNLLLDKETFEFGMTVNIDSVSDEQDVAETVADMMTAKLFNVIGLKDSKGNN